MYTETCKANYVYNCCDIHTHTVQNEAYYTHEDVM